jgi:hypothetical protein
MSSLVPRNPSALAHLACDADGIAARPPETQIHRYGINQIGQLYKYGQTATQPERVLSQDDAIVFLGLRDCSVHQRKREYLDLEFYSEVPHLLRVVSLPCYATPLPWHIRTILGSLTHCAARLDMHDTPGKISARRGTGGSNPDRIANFLDLYLLTDTAQDCPFERVYADAIGGTRDDLEIAVNNLRRALDLEPQFL